MSKLDIENSLIERNGSFSESVSTTFVYDCRFEVKTAQNVDFTSRPNGKAVDST